METDAYEKRQHWLWVTRPKFYLDENGDERAELDPSVAPDSDGWWTCHKDTHKGDFVLLYSPRQFGGSMPWVRDGSFSRGIASRPPPWPPS